MAEAGEPAAPRVLDAPPPDLDDLVPSIARGYALTYGEPAGEFYRQNGRRIFTELAQSDQVRLWATGSADRTRIVLLEQLREARGEVLFAHALAQDPAELASMVRSVTEALAERGATSALAEFVPTDGADWSAAFRAAGYTVVNREILSKPIGALEQSAESTISVPASPEHWNAMAACLVDAYADHPGQELHIEVAEVPRALGLIERVLSGQAGASNPSLVRSVWQDGQCIGIAIGAVVAPGVGFLIQIAVRRSVQGRGIGRRLLREMAHEFAAHGAHRLMLGVTLDNPARALYHAEGFKHICPFSSHLWRAGA